MFKKILSVVMLACATFFVQADTLPVSVMDVHCIYDGESHGLDVVGSDGCLVSYWNNGVWTVGTPTFRDVVMTNVVIKVTKSGFDDFISTNTVSITPRQVMMISESATWAFNGMPHSANELVAASEGFVAGETYSVNWIGEITNVGTTNNAFEIVWDGTAKESNYEVTTNFGILHVMPPADGIYTQNVDGVVWTYTIRNGEASVGGGSYTNTAVAVTTEGALTIPQTLGGCPVTSIADDAFYGCTELTSVVVPRGVLKIGAFSFDNCSSLQSVSLPEGLSRLGGLNVFCGCESLETINIPSTVTSIGDLAFQSCGLVSITIPSNVVSIGDGAFAGCTRLAQIALDNNTNFTTRNGLLCSRDGKTVLACPGSFDSIVIPDDMTELGDYSFDRCPNLGELLLPSSLTTIGRGTIAHCPIQTLHIPENVSYIDDYQFGGCDSLTNFTVDVNNLYFSAVNGLLCNKTGVEIVHCPRGATEISIPSTIVSVRNGAFDYYSKLQIVHVEKGDKERVQRMIESANPFSMSDNVAYLEPGVKPDGSYSEVVGGYTWNYSVTSGVAVITQNSGPLAGQVVIPDALGGCPVVGIGSFAFMLNSSLTSVTLPDTLCSIDSWAFYYCSSLKYVTFLGNEDDVSIGEYAFVGTPYEDGWDVPFLDIADEEVVGLIWKHLHDDCGCITNGCVVIPDGITFITSNALEDFNELEKVVIPASVQSVGDFGFAWCTNLAEVVLVDTAMTSCSSTAFCGTPWKLHTVGWNLPFFSTPASGSSVPLNMTYSLVTESVPCAVTNGMLCIPDGVTSIPSSAFMEVCDVKIRSVVCPSTMRNVGAEGLAACHHLELFEMRSPDIDIASDAFGTDEAAISKIAFVLNAGSNVLRGWKLSSSGAVPTPSPDTYPVEGNGAFMIGSGYEARPLTAALKVGPGELSTFNFSVTNGIASTTLKAVVSGVSGAVWTDFVTCAYQGNGYGEVSSCQYLTSAAIVDVEKTAKSDADDHACYYLPQINMAYWGGWIPKADYASEDAVADEFRALGYFPDVVSWITNKYDSSILNAIVYNTTNSFSASGFNKYIVDNLSDGNALIQLFTDNSSHGITCCGYACDETKRVTDAGYLRGLFIVDSDNDMNNNGGGSLAPNRIAYCELRENQSTDCSVEYCPYQIANIWGLAWDAVYCGNGLRTNGKSVLHTVTFDPGEHGNASGGVPLVQSVTNGCAAIAPTIVANVGWKFIGWNKSFETVAEDMTVMAIYEQLPSWVETEVVEGVEWTFAVSGDKASVGGGTVKLTAVPTSTSGAIRVPLKLGGYDVTGVSKSAFENCRGIESVIVPEGVTVIGGGAFRACSGLTNVTLASSVRTIGMFAFCGCRGLKQADIPAGVTTIGLQAFSCCYGLETLTLSSTLAKIGESAFEKCRSIAIVRFSGDVPEGLADSGLIDASADTPKIYYPDAYAANYERIVPEDQRGGIVGALTMTLLSASNGKDVVVSNTWAVSDLENRFGIGKAAKYVARYGKDLVLSLFKETGKISSDGKKMTVLDDYVAGTDPTDESSRLQANVSLDANGVPLVTWTPDLNEGGQKAERVYRVLGATDLNGEWKTIESGQSTDCRFFKVVVEMP